MTNLLTVAVGILILAVAFLGALILAVPFVGHFVGKYWDWMEKYLKRKF